MQFDYAKRQFQTTEEVAVLFRKKGKQERECGDNSAGQEKKYSVFSNVIFLMRGMMMQSGQVKFIFPLRIIIKLFYVSMPIVLSAAAVSAVENHEGAVAFFWKVGLLAVLYTLSQAAEVVIDELYGLHACNTRIFLFMVNMLKKSITTDYCNREEYDKQKIFSKALNAMQSNWVGIERALREMPSIVFNFFGMILFGGAILAVDVRILVVLLLMLVFNVATNHYARNYLVRHREEDSELSRREYYLRGVCSDIHSGKDARIYGMEKWFGKLLEGYVNQGLKWQRGIEKHYYLPVASDTVFIALRDCLAYVLLIQMAVRGEISLASLTLMLGVVSNFATWMFEFVSSCEGLKDANEGVSDYRRAVSLEDSFLHGEGVTVGQMLHEPVEIEFRDVSFYYETEHGEKKHVFRHLNLHIKKGEKVALVGNNGAGKTTLVKLLCGFYHPTGGEILVNGISIEKYNIEEYFKLLGVVFQDVSLLDFTILNQVTGQMEGEADLDRFWDAVDRAGMKEKILSLDRKENTFIHPVLDDHGIEVSGGEAQKLMLARCIYKDAPLLLLDEPTAALDPIAESNMYREYQSMTEGKTSIFISHRLASTKFCDRILFLENGEIVEEGSHDALLRKGGRYAKIYEIQSHYYDAGGKRNDHHAFA